MFKSALNLYNMTIYLHAVRHMTKLASKNIHGYDASGRVMLWYVKRQEKMSPLFTNETKLGVPLSAVHSRFIKLNWISMIKW